MTFTPADRPLAYQRQDSGQTLAEALWEYYAANQGRVSPPGDLPPESFALFRNHDICHVVFGLDTSLRDEVLVDARTLLSCDVGFTRYAAYLAHDQQARALFRELGYVKGAWVTLLAVPRIVRAIWEALRMPRRWPWSPPESFQARRLDDLRHAFRIRVF
jgi:hypothetical protein